MADCNDNSCLLTAVFAFINLKLCYSHLINRELATYYTYAQAYLPLVQYISNFLTDFISKVQFANRTGQ